MEYDTNFNYSPVALKHMRHPRNCGPLMSFMGHASITGTCGESIEFWVLVRGNRLEEVSFVSDSCGPSLACGSMTACLAEGKTLEEAAALGQQDILHALGGLPKESEHCALLAADALHAACDHHIRIRDSERVIAQEEVEKDVDAEAAPQAMTCAPVEFAVKYDERRVLQERLSKIRHKIVVLSGKSGVGKSTIAVNMATSLMMSGYRVGLLDVDTHGPGVPTMLGLGDISFRYDEEEIFPVDLGGIKVMSIGFFLSRKNNALIWRGPWKTKGIRQLLRDTSWGELDFLVVDVPPGTGDEPRSICQMIDKMDGAVVVTTPQLVATEEIRKSISFCRELKIPVLGVVENMNGFFCPHYGEVTPIFESEGGKEIAKDMEVPFLGSIPIDPRIGEASDSAQGLVDRYAATSMAETIRNVVNPIVAREMQDAAE
jgi:ATP-binding protein involved in chromosome partitioning